MRLTMAILCVAVCFSTPARAQDPKPDDSKLVETAKQSKKARKKSTTKVITNSDVKKSKGKLIVLSSPDAKADANTAKAPETLQQQDDRYRARQEAKQRVIAAEKKVTELEKSVEDLEQQYYEANDPNYRDDVIQKRFAQTKRQLDEARQQLADERDALQRLDKPKP